MKIMQKYSVFVNWFEDYVNSYNLNPKDQENINLKIHHTYRVCKEIVDIGNSLNLNELDIFLAKTIALFHDIGRFEQYAKYKTFSDAKSEDHALLGIKILLNNNILEELGKSNIKIIINAIQYHNKVKIPSNLDAKSLLFTKLIRDADKLDIWRVVIDYYEKKSNNEKIGLGLLNEPYISDEIYNAIKNKEIIGYDKLKTINDLKLLQMAWIYDINFHRTFEIIKERNYLKKIYDTLPKSERIYNIYKEMENYLNEMAKQ
ncbi:HD domain-containing protein [Methanothermococcus okinawensis]|uniref:Metal-dependent phosphohydrolase HD sub domain protein n=1 Tax=Methanothermococcus okinawensis (strain DSM 14208 / JCM 11175 / IH1) TaxID=647113 RepID=F8AJL8_METOI|nr:HD domain-containing protein [Methanothermococcus okinawensis]AEH07204.1 metal-dependent phosphohydrolase HD sub domain protein [Methanothermococcus okinawensis IH1]